MELPFIRITTREGDTEQSIEIGHAPSQLLRPLSIALAAEPISGTTECIVLDANEATATLEWSTTLNDGERMTFADAEMACVELGAGWRLPTRTELLTLVDDTRHDPAIDTSKYPDTKSGYYWTATPCAWAPSCAWCVDFSYGVVDGDLRDDLAFVRAVRSVPAGQ